MKKLMIAAVAMASTVALAKTQVYDVKINLKTTACKKATLRADQNPFHPAAGEIQYRNPATITIQGLIWACDCDYIEDLGQTKVGTSKAWMWYRFASDKAYSPAAAQLKGREGYVFWNAKTRAPWGYATIDKTDDTTADKSNLAKWKPTAGDPMPTLTWQILQRIGSRAEKVEGVWLLTDGFSRAEKYRLTGAGFGSARVGTVATTADNAGIGAQAAAAVNGLNECAEAIITSISGNVAGWIQQGDTNDDTCVFCGSNAQCSPWPFCNCAQNTGYNATRTAAYGTWSMKYNASLSRRLLSHESIRDIYSFSEATAEVVRWLEANAL